MEEIDVAAGAEAQLRELQKMESIGRLAIAIVHDFNNILPAIFGNVECMSQELPLGHPALDSLNGSYRASSRVNNLVRHILAFRRRQVTDKHVMDSG
jgi:signal transduction histidine kinase